MPDCAERDNRPTRPSATAMRHSLCRANLPTPQRARTAGALVVVLVGFAAPLPWAAGLPPGEARGVTVRIIGGQVTEQPTGDPDELIQDELHPDQPFPEPLEPATLEGFRAFYSRVGPTLDVTAEQLAAVQRRAEQDPEARGQLEALIAEARAWLPRPILPYQPSHWHWIHGPREEARHIEERAAGRAAMRRSCALAFALTGEEPFAQKAWAAFRAQIEHFYTHGVFRMPYSWQSPWDTGHELYDAAACYDMLAHWEGLRPLDHALVFTYLRRLGRRVAYAVELSPVIGSQQAMWTSNLGCVALFAPTMPEAARWKRLVDERIYNVMSDFMSDGGHIETDPAQHAFALQHVMRYARFAAREGDRRLLSRASGEAGVTIERAVDWMARIATPLGEMPGINDSRPRPLATHDFFLDAVNTYRRGDWLRAARLDPARAPLFQEIEPDIEPRDPAYRSVLLPQTGFAVMRDGWEEDDAYLLLDFGRHGGPHGHLDKLNIIMYAHGQPWLPDAGAAPDMALFAEEHERWHRQTVAHNTVLIDDRSQRPADGELVAWHTHPAFDIAAAEHTAYPDAVHRRTVFRPRGGYFLVLDEVVNKSAEERPMEALYHVDGRRQSGTTGRVVFRREGGFGLCILPAPHRALRGVSIAEGLAARWEEEPEGEAWIPGGPGWPLIPYIGLKMLLPPHKTRTSCVALIPFRDPEPQAAIEHAEGELTHVVALTIGDTRDRIVIRRRGAGEGQERLLGVATDARYAFVREEHGKITTLEYVAGTSLSVE